MAGLGARIRALRLRQGMTLPALSQISGLSPGFLSQIETGKASLSLESLEKIADALGGCPGDFFQAPSAPQVIRADRRPRLRWGDGPEVEYLAPLPQASQLQAALVTLASGEAAGGSDHVHAGEELAWVLAGRLTLRHADQVVDLQMGDSVAVDGRVPHTYEAVGPEPAQLLIINTPPAALPLSE